MCVLALLLDADEEYVDMVICLPAFELKGSISHCECIINKAKMASQTECIWYYFSLYFLIKDFEYIFAHANMSSA